VEKKHGFLRKKTWKNHLQLVDFPI
jgi:hypothetical protein